MVDITGLPCPVLLAPRDAGPGLAAANGGSFVAGAVLGPFLLRRRLGRVPTGEVLSPSTFRRDRDRGWVGPACRSTAWVRGGTGVAAAGRR